MRRAIALLLATLFCEGALIAQTSPASIAPAALMPLAIGNTWTYEMSEVGVRGDMLENDDDELSSQTVTMTVSREVRLAGQTFFAIPMGDDEMFLANADSGVYAWDEQQAQSWLILPFPATAGERIQWEVQRGHTFVTDVAAVDAKVTIGGDVLSCYQYNIHDGSATNPLEIYVAPGLGIVRIATSAMSDEYNVRMRMDLVRHTVKSIEVDAKSDVK